MSELQATTPGDLSPNPQSSASVSAFNLVGKLAAGKGVLTYLPLLIALALGLAILVVGFMWLDRTTYRTVYPGMSERDSGEILTALQKSGMPVQVESLSGNIQVPGEKVHEARFLLASEGLPRGSGSGYEFLNNESQLGTSAFLDTARYRHALENEIARSVMSIGPVIGARVHLAIPDRSAFVREQKPTTASVVVKLGPGRNLDAGQVTAVAHVVSTAVPGLTAAAVSIVDQFGRLLNGGGDGAEPGLLNTRQLDYKRRLETSYVERIEAILTPIVGLGRVRAQATVDVNFEAVERTEERYTPAQGGAIRSERVTRQLPVQTGEAAQGVPGALANQPPVNVEEKTQEELALASNSEREWTRNYELDKSISHIKSPVGAVRRLSVAVVIDDIEIVDDAGKKTRGAVPAETMQQLKGLVQDAVGYDDARGDSVNLINTSFREVEVIAGLNWWELPWVHSLARIALFLIAGLLGLLMVVRPLIRAIINASTASRASSASLTGSKKASAALLKGGAVAAGSAAALAESDEVDFEAEVPDLGLEYQEDINMVRRVAASDPARAAQVLKRWLDDNG
jgi:flagellar M-ring protein FliF